MLDAALDADDREWVQEHVKGCGSCGERQALIRAQGQALRDVFAAKPAAFDGFADKVMARVAADKAGAPASVWGSEMWGAHRRAFTAFGGVALAACMALAVVFVPPKPQPAAVAAVVADATEIEQVDFGTHDGAVLQLPRQTTVIWMSEDRQ